MLTVSGLGPLRGKEHGMSCPYPLEKSRVSWWEAGGSDAWGTGGLWGLSCAPLPPTWQHTPYQKGAEGPDGLATFHQGHHINTFRVIGPKCKQDGYRDSNCLVRKLLEGTLKTNKIMGIRH